ncbi:MAG: hypothetical protein FP816_20765 [Desulfobacteraceae bacterium]|nr:hypothetical protein [Desulfobacteraceae bacterium]
MKRRSFLKIGLAGIGSLAIPIKSWALKYFLKPTDKKWAVIYGTWCGSSRDAAIWISEGMGGIADVFDVRENPDLTGFDHLVIGGSIRASRVSSELKNFLEKNRGFIKNKIRGYFIICGNMRQPITPEQKNTFIDQHLALITGVNDVPGKVFLGRMTKSLLDSQSLQVIESMGGQDYDAMNRPDFLVFGQTILNSMKD